MLQQHSDEAMLKVAPDISGSRIQRSCFENARSKIKKEACVLFFLVHSR